MNLSDLAIALLALAASVILYFWAIPIFETP